jgi:predicted AlkP superfamily phosphohydrolase/phosphomutase
VNPKKLLIIGLDCAEPSLVFDKWRKHLPNLNHLIKHGIWGNLRSCDPPITIPAWTCMFSGKTPGELGVYGFRLRRDTSYGNLSVTSSRDVKTKRVWDILGEHGKRSIVIGVPHTYPPSPLNGLMVSGLLTPSKSQIYTYPQQLRDEIRRIAPEYACDISQFRNLDPYTILEDIKKMTQQRFQLANHLIITEKWDCFILVEIGLDRIQHIFWGYADPQSPYYEEGGRFEHVLLDYYRQLDRHIGELISLAGGEPSIMIVSDHGAQRLHGGFCINQWLIENDFLRLKTDSTDMREVNPDGVDWTKTRAWAEGGYYARIFLNIIGREPQGIVSTSDKDKIKMQLVTEMESDSGVPPLRVYTPEELYPQVNGIPPDLLVYIDDLRYRAIGTIGHDTLIVRENDTGTDHINHSFKGIFILSGTEREPGNRPDTDIYEITPTILEHFGIQA